MSASDLLKLSLRPIVRAFRIWNKRRGIKSKQWRADQIAVEIKAAHRHLAKLHREIAVDRSELNEI